MSKVSIPLIAAVVAFTTIESDAKEILYVHNTLSGEISKISIPEHEVIGEIPIGHYMDFVTKSPDNKILYVNRIESAGLDRAPNVGESGELIAIDPRTDHELWRVQLDGMPQHMTVSPDGRYIFVPYFDSLWVAVVDTETKKIVRKIGIGYGGHGSQLSADGKLLYVGSMMNDHLSVIDVDSFELLRQIPYDDAVRPFAITRDGKTAYVQLSRFHGFVVTDLESGKKIKTVRLPDLPAGVKMPEFYPHNVNHGIKLTPDETMLFVNGSIANYVAVYSHPGLELIKTIPVGTDPNSVAFSADGNYAYVSNRGSDDLSVISVEKLEEIKRIKLGDYPQRMVIIDVPE